MQVLPAERACNWLIGYSDNPGMDRQWDTFIPDHVAELQSGHRPTVVHPA